MIRAIGAVVARFLDTEEVTGSNPVSRTNLFMQVRSGFNFFQSGLLLFEDVNLCPIELS